MNEANHLKFDQGQPRVKGIFPQKMAGCSWLDVQEFLKNIVPQTKKASDPKASGFHDAHVAQRVRKSEFP